MSRGQVEHRQILPRPGWLEHDPVEIRTAVDQVLSDALARGQVPVSALAAVGITNQRETAVVWDRWTGRPIHNAVVWQDTRTQGIVDRLAGSSAPDGFAARVGLPLSTYFTGPKVTWILDNVSGARARAEAGDLLAGTVDSWILWNLTGGVEGGVHATDVTNASRTMLMNIDTLDWDPEVCAALDIPLAMLPTIGSSVEPYGTGALHGPVAGVPIAGILGDQQAAAFGQACFTPGSAKNTYGTGGFLLLNTGTAPVRSGHGLLTTLSYRIGQEDPVYALEGSVAVAGALVQWLRDGLGLIGTAAEVEASARRVDDAGGVYIVPAFSGLLAPHWRPEARGVIVGLSQYVTSAHLCRAALEAVAYQTRDVVEAMSADIGRELTELKVDGGMVANALLLQLQADVLGLDVVRPRVTETTALGAAYAAGLGVGFWSGLDELSPTGSRTAVGTRAPLPRAAASPTVAGRRPSGPLSDGWTTKARARTATVRLDEMRRVLGFAARGGSPERKEPARTVHSKRASQSTSPASRTGFSGGSGPPLRVHRLPARLHSRRVLGPRAACYS